MLICQVLGLGFQGLEEKNCEENIDQNTDLFRKSSIKRCFFLNCSMMQ